MSSFASHLASLAIRLRGSKLLFRSPAAMRKRVAKLRLRPKPFAPSEKLARIVDIRILTIAGWTVYEVGPRGGSPARRALYLHGGAYVFEIAPQHWTLVAQLAVQADCRFLVPIYPLAPAETADTIVPKATDLAEHLVAEVGAHNVSLLGDSAGGGMALAVAMQLRDRGVAAPQATVLISPWLDISGTDPALAAIEPRDPWLAVPGSRAAGEIYRGPLGENDPMVSPINGDLTALGAVTIFSGTRDILNADARKLTRLAAAADLPIDFHQVRDMIHVFPLLPIPEAKTARATIVRAMTGR